MTESIAVITGKPVRLDMVGLFATDMRTMVAFYRDVIGLQTDWDGASPYADFRNEGIRFAMYSRPLLPDLLGKEPGYPEGINGTFELSLNVGDPGKVDLVYDFVLLRGATPVYAPRDEPWKMRSAMVADPEGNLIEIASDFWD